MSKYKWPDFIMTRMDLIDPLYGPVTIMVERGVEGYKNTKPGSQNINPNKINKELHGYEISEELQMAYIYGSMFGWDFELAKPAMELRSE